MYAQFKTQGQHISYLISLIFFKYMFILNMCKVVDCTKMPDWNFPNVKMLIGNRCHEWVWKAHPQKAQSFMSDDRKKITTLWETLSEQIVQQFKSISKLTTVWNLEISQYTAHNINPKESQKNLCMHWARLKTSSESLWPQPAPHEKPTWLYEGCA